MYFDIRMEYRIMLSQLNNKWTGHEIIDVIPLFLMHLDTQQ